MISTSITKKATVSITHPCSTKIWAKTAIMETEDTTPIFDNKIMKFIQGVTGTFLFYAHAVKSTMLTALSAIAGEQAKPTEKSSKPRNF